jgi:hypothetical protein
VWKYQRGSSAGRALARILAANFMTSDQSVVR